ncbi:MAG: hypothetical protein KAV99_00170 [Candidatus Latescibacteria bacterium]|nr:hypothetical protein [Candidatus Latescibacterota bacterium]
MSTCLSIFEGDKPKAVIIPVELFKALTTLLESLSLDADKEAQILAQSPTFKSLVERGLREIKEGKLESWRNTFDEI